MIPAEHRQAQLAYVADLWTHAWYASRNVGNWDLTADENYRQTALAAGGRIGYTDHSGADLDSIRVTVAAALAAQDFQHVAVSLFLDDLVHDSAELAREMRQAES